MGLAGAVRRKAVDAALKGVEKMEIWSPQLKRGTWRRICFQDMDVGVGNIKGGLGQDITRITCTIYC